MSAVPADQVESATAFLLKAGPAGVSLYDHLTEVVYRVLETQAENAYEHFEELSRVVKEDHVGPDSQALEEKSTAFAQATAAAAASSLALFKPVPQATDDDGNPIESEPNDGRMPDVLRDANVMDMCGIGLQRDEAIRLTLAMRRLVEGKPLKSVRFWGKVLGLEADYYVVEGEFKEGEHPDEKAAAEAGDGDGDDDAAAGAAGKGAPEVPAEKRAGANLFSYFVCNRLGDAWTLLPDVTPKQISAARLVKKYLTGRLAASVDTYPPFPGDESGLLRAAIARISASCAISPKGLLNVPELTEEEEEGSNEPFTVRNSYEKLDAEGLVSLENWIHHSRALLTNQARCVFWSPPAEGDDGDGEAVEAETGPEFGASLAEDAKIFASAAWSAVDVAKVLQPGTPVALVRSTRWPGAFAFGADGGSHSNWVYVGYGHKYTGLPYNPPLPAPVAEAVAQAQTFVEADEPTADEEAEFDRADERARAAADAAANVGDDD